MTASTSSRLVRLSSRALLVLRGKDTFPFLQGLLTRDIDSISPSGASLILDTNGRIVHDVLLKKRPNADDGILLECRADGVEQLKKLLLKYRLRKKVTIDVSDEAVLWSVAAVEGGVEDARTKELGYRVYASHQQQEEGDDAYTKHRWSLGVAEGAELTALLPYNANADLLHQVSANKGCYVGQELTARTATQGMLRRRIIPFTCEDAVKEKGDITNEQGKKVGRVIVSGGGRGLALLAHSTIQLPEMGEPVKVTVDGQVIRPFRPSFMSGVKDLSSVYV